MVSACELHVPGLDYEDLTPDLVTSLAVVTAATTGRIRWSGARVHAGTVVLVPGMKEEHFDRLAAAKSICAKFIFFPLATNKDEALKYHEWCRARGIRTKVHTGGVSRSGLSQMCGYDILSWLKPDIAAHISGGPIPMSDDDLDKVIDTTSFAVEICSSGNYGSTKRAVDRMREKGQLARLTLGTDTPGGTGVIPRGMFRNICYLASVCGVKPAEAVAIATGNTAKAHGLDVGILAPGRPGGPDRLRPGRRLGRHQHLRRHRPRRPAGHRLCDRRRRDRGQRPQPPDAAAEAKAVLLLLRRARRVICGIVTFRPAVSRSPGITLRGPSTCRTPSRASRNQTKFDGANEIGPLMPNTAIWNLSPAFAALVSTTRFGVLMPWIMAGLGKPERRFNCPSTQTSA